MSSHSGIFFVIDRSVLNLWKVLWPERHDWASHEACYESLHLISAAGCRKIQLFSAAHRWLNRRPVGIIIAFLTAFLFPLARPFCFRSLKSVLLG